LPFELYVEEKLSLCPLKDKLCWARKIIIFINSETTCLLKDICIFHPYSKLRIIGAHWALVFIFTEDNTWSVDVSCLLILKIPFTHVQNPSLVQVLKALFIMQVVTI
jgi:hypothetical protein